MTCCWGIPIWSVSKLNILEKFGRILNRNFITKDLIIWDIVPLFLLVTLRIPNSDRIDKGARKFVHVCVNNRIIHESILPLS